MGKDKIAGCVLAILFATGISLQAQTLPVPDGRSLREIVAEKFPDGRLLIGGTTGSWAFGTPDGKIMDREFSYVTPENDFKHSIVRGNPSTWNWSRADAWKQHIIDNEQVLRIHGPIGPQCSNWAREDTRTAQELSQELDAFMKALCQRYDNVEGIEYLDVVNEIALADGNWHQPKPGIEVWENPWFIIGQDTDPNRTPLYVKRAFAIANQYAPNLKLILNNHSNPGTAGMEKVKETIIYLRNRGYRVDGLGWQGHVDVGWATEQNLNELRKVMDWCRDMDLEFHVTEFSAWISDTATQTLEEQAYTYKAVIDILWDKLGSLPVGWNTWHISDATGWQTDKIPSMFDDSYYPKPAYYAVQQALESIWDFTIPYTVTFNIKSRETGENLEGCEILFNGENKYTDTNGMNTFQDITAGWYDLEVNKEHKASYVSRYLGIHSDTVITIMMDPALYEVRYHLVDHYSLADISSVEIKIDSMVQTTDMNGMATFRLPVGNYTAAFHRSDYQNHQFEHQVISDTLFTTMLEKTHAKIKFWLKTGDVPVNMALVVLAEDSLYTNSLGICTFESIPLDSSYHYTVIKEKYKPAGGSFYLKTDTAINLQLSKSLAIVQFALSTGGPDAKNAFVVMNGDTTWIVGEGIGAFYDIPVDTEYPYRVLSDNYPEYSGQVFVVRDTLVTVLLTVGNNPSSTITGNIIIYPNPAGDYLYILSETEFDQIAICDASGSIIRQIHPRAAGNPIDLSGFTEGIYWLMLGEEGVKSCIVRPFVVRR